MSHELRTPMNAVLGFAQLMEMDDLSPSHAEGVEQLLNGGRRLLKAEALDYLTKPFDVKNFLELLDGMTRMK